MVKSALAAFAVICVAIGLMHLPELPSAPPSCPGGVCPVPISNVSYQSVSYESLPLPTAMPVQITAVAPVVSANHWTHPSDIATHLADTHGVSASGMSREQALTLHDQLHESGTMRTVSRSYVSYQPQPVYRVAQVAMAPVRYVAARRPIRSVASIPVRLLQRQPVRSAVRRLFCR